MPDTASMTSLFKGLSPLLPIVFRTALAICMDFAGSFLCVLSSEKLFLFTPQVMGMGIDVRFTQSTSQLGSFLGLGSLFVVGERGGIGDKERDGPLNHMETLELLSTPYQSHSHLTLG